MADNNKIQVYKNHRPHRYYPDPSVAQAFYSPDSSARQLEAAYPEPAYQPEPREDIRPSAPRPAPKSKKLRKVKTKPEFDEDIQARHRYNFLSYALVFAFFDTDLNESLS